MLVTIGHMIDSLGSLLEYLIRQLGVHQHQGRKADCNRSVSFAQRPNNAQRISEQFQAERRDFGKHLLWFDQH